MGNAGGQGKCASGGHACHDGLLCCVSPVNHASWNVAVKVLASMCEAIVCGLVAVSAKAASLDLDDDDEEEESE